MGAMGRRNHQAHAPAAQRAGKRQLGQRLGQWHDGSQRQGRRAADKNIKPEGEPMLDRQRVMHADAAVNLIMQPDLPIRLILIAARSCTRYMPRLE